MVWYIISICGSLQIHNALPGMPCHHEDKKIYKSTYSSVDNSYRPVAQGYRKTPNKRPWAFAGGVALEGTFSPSMSFLQNENRTIFSRDIAKNVRKRPNMRSRVQVGSYIRRLLGVLRYLFLTQGQPLSEAGSPGGRPKKTISQLPYIPHKSITTQIAVQKVD